MVSCNQSLDRAQYHQSNHRRHHQANQQVHQLGHQPKFDKYLCQLKLYIYWLRLQYECEVQGWLSLALMHKAYDPQFRCFDISFEARELHEAYMACMNHAKAKGFL